MQFSDKTVAMQGNIAAKVGEHSQVRLNSYKEGEVTSSKAQDSQFRDGKESQ